MLFLFPVYNLLYFFYKSIQKYNVMCLVDVAVVCGKQYDPYFVVNFNSKFMKIRIDQFLYKLV